MVPVADGMASVGTEVDLRAALSDLIDMTAPPVPFAVTLAQIWGTEETSEEVTAPVVRVPRGTDPPFPAYVPSQAVADAWLPTFMVSWGSMVALTPTWSSVVMVTEPEPESSVQVMT